MATGDLTGAAEAPSGRAGLRRAAGRRRPQRRVAAGPERWPREAGRRRGGGGGPGRRRRALTGPPSTYRAGLAIVRRLTEAHLDVFLPELARSLTSLGVVLTELGRHDEAQALDRQAAKERPYAAQAMNSWGNSSRIGIVDRRNGGTGRLLRSAAQTP